MELEFVQVNLEERFGTFDHCYPHEPCCLASDFFEGYGCPQKMSRCRTVVHRDDNTGRVIMATGFFRKQEGVARGRLRHKQKEIRRSKLFWKIREL